MKACRLFCSCDGINEVLDESCDFGSKSHCREFPSFATPKPMYESFIGSSTSKFHGFIRVWFGDGCLRLETRCDATLTVAQWQWLTAQVDPALTL